MVWDYITQIFFMLAGAWFIQNSQRRWIWLSVCVAALISFGLARHYNQKEESIKAEKLDSILLRITEIGNISKPIELVELEEIAKQNGIKITELLSSLKKGTPLQQAVNAYIKKDYDKAIALLEESVPDGIFKLANSWFYIGNAYAGKENWSKAIEYYHKVVELEPNAFQALHFLAQMYMKIHEFDKADQYLRDAIRVNPDRGEPYINLGYILNKFGKYDDAIELLKKGIELNPSNMAIAYSNLGVAMKGKGKLVEAKSYFEKALGLNPSKEVISNVYVNYGNMTTGNEAIGFFKRAIEVDPKNALAYYNWGTALLNNGLLTEAEQKLRLALEFDPYLAEAYHNLVVVLVEKRDYSSEEKFRIGKYSKENEDFTEEERLIRKADELKPDDAWIQNTLGDVLRLQGRHQEAIEAYKKAIKKEPRINIGVFTPSLYYEELRGWQPSK
jgi:tetratricopeptide (TPR) repeat protein